MIIGSGGRLRIGGRPPTPGATGPGRQFTVNLAEQMSGADELASALADFKREAQKTPRERCRDQVLKEWNLTQDFIDSLPPREAQELSDRIEQEVARRMQSGEATTSRAVAEAIAPDAAAPQTSVEPTSTLDAFGLRGQPTTLIRSNTPN